MPFHDVTALFGPNTQFSSVPRPDPLSVFTCSITTQHPGREQRHKTKRHKSSTQTWEAAFKNAHLHRESVSQSAAPFCRSRTSRCTDESASLATSISSVMWPQRCSPNTPFFPPALPLPQDEAAVRSVQWSDGDIYPTALPLKSARRDPVNEPESSRLTQQCSRGLETRFCVFLQWNWHVFVRRHPIRATTFSIMEPPFTCRQRCDNGPRWLKWKGASLQTPTSC